MAKNELTGNMPTENLLWYFNDQSQPLHLKEDKFNQAIEIAKEIFPG